MLLRRLRWDILAVSRCVRQATGPMGTPSPRSARRRMRAVPRRPPTVGCRRPECGTALPDIPSRAARGTDIRTTPARRYAVAAPPAGTVHRYPCRSGHRSLQANYRRRAIRDTGLWAASRSSARPSLDDDAGRQRRAPASDSAHSGRQGNVKRENAEQTRQAKRRLPAREGSARNRMNRRRAETSFRRMYYTGARALSWQRRFHCRRHADRRYRCAKRSGS